MLVVKTYAKQMVQNGWAEMLSIFRKHSRLPLGEELVALFRLHRFSVTSGLFTEMSKLIYTI